MAKTTVIDWQRDSLLLARGDAQGGRIVLDRVAVEEFSIPEQPGSRDPSAAVRRAVSAIGFKGPVSVLVARELVELRSIQIPQMDPTDLPDVIRFQAQRQFTSMTDSWVVDFVLLPRADDQEKQTALVAAMSPVQLAEIDNACAASGLQVERILLRPLEAARLAIKNAKTTRAPSSMVICLSDSMADILLLRDGHVVQVRSTKLPEDAEQRAMVMQSEIRRSCMAGASELAGDNVSSVTLVASDKVSQGLSESIGNVLKADVETICLEQMIDWSSSQTSVEQLVSDSGPRLAGIAGAMGAAATPAISIDFKHPKKRPPKQKNTRTMILAAVAGAAVLLLAAGWYYSRISQLNNEYAEYMAEINSRQEVGKSAEARIAELKALERFLDASPNWLDEMTHVVQKMPSSGQVKLENPSFSVSTKGEGVISVVVKADNADSISAFEESIRGPNHIVSGTGAIQLTTPEENYRWRASSSIVIVGRGWKVQVTEPTAAKQQPTKGNSNDSPPEDSDTSSTEVILEGAANDAT